MRARTATRIPIARAVRVSVIAVPCRAQQLPVTTNAGALNARRGAATVGNQPALPGGRRGGHTVDGYAYPLYRGYRVSGAGPLVHNCSGLGTLQEGPVSRARAVSRTRRANDADNGHRRVGTAGRRRRPMRLDVEKKVATRMVIAVGDLHERYVGVFGERARRRGRRCLIRPMAWRIQATQGELNGRALPRAENLANASDAGAPRGAMSQPAAAAIRVRSGNETLSRRTSLSVSAGACRRVIGCSLLTFDGGFVLVLRRAEPEEDVIFSRGA